MSTQDYQSDQSAGTYIYPQAGDPAPRKGAKVQLLTIGGIHTTGPWDDSGFYIGWLPLPKRDKDKEELIYASKK